jgi:hypothetical protein
MRRDPELVRRTSLRPDHWARRLPLVGGAVGVLALAASFALGRQDPEQLAFSWLVAFLFFLSLALGALFFVLAQFVSRAGWSIAVRRVAELTMGTLPLFLLLFIPLLLWMEELFPWSREGAAEADHLLAVKEPYLNVPFFLVRAGVYFFAWLLLSRYYLRQSVRQDHSGERQITRRLNLWSGLGLIVFALTTTFASFDWIMSLDPHWYSTIFGVYFFSGSLVGFFALLVVMMVALGGDGPLRGIVTLEHFHDVGKFLFAFAVFWSYIAFSQFFLIWYGNIPEETAWFIERSHGSWLTVTGLLAVGHFGVPFFFLLSRWVKRRSGLLMVGALWMLFMHLVDLHWLIMPTHHHDGLHLTLLDLTTLLAVGGLFVAVLGWLASRHALVPVSDPRLAESLGFENI